MIETGLEGEANCGGGAEVAGAKDGVETNCGEAGMIETGLGGETNCGGGAEVAGVKDGGGRGLGAIAATPALTNLVRSLVLLATGVEGPEGTTSGGESSSVSTLMTHGTAGGSALGSSSLMAGWRISALTRLSCS